MDEISITPTTLPKPGGSHDVTEAIVTEVAVAKGVSPLDLEPIATVVDPDALEAFVASTDDEATRQGASLEFSYENVRVVVAGDGTVSLEEDASNPTPQEGESRDGGYRTGIDP